MVKFLLTVSFKGVKQEVKQFVVYDVNIMCFLEAKFEHNTLFTDNLRKERGGHSIAN